jgi:hypothetical protein
MAVKAPWEARDDRSLFVSGRSRSASPSVADRFVDRSSESRRRWWKAFVLRRRRRSLATAGIVASALLLDFARPPTPGSVSGSNPSSSRMPTSNTTNGCARRAAGLLGPARISRSVTAHANRSRSRPRPVRTAASPTGSFATTARSAVESSEHDSASSRRDRGFCDAPRGMSLRPRDRDQHCPSPSAGIVGRRGDGVSRALLRRRRIQAAPGGSFGSTFRAPDPPPHMPTR